MPATKIHASVLVLLLVIPSLPARALDDATALALEISGELLAPAELVARVDEDLAAIRTENPQLESIHARLDWVAGDLLIALTPEAWQQHLDGQYRGLDSRNEQYGSVVVKPLRLSRVLHLDFEQTYHAEVLAGLYADADGVLRSGPNHYAGDGNDISSPRGVYTGMYTFREAWGDCPSGCLNERIWQFRVEDGQVFAVPIAVEKTDWSTVKGLYRE